MAIWTVLIALAASFGEMLSKYETKVLRDILNRYLFVYLGINAVFAFATYCFLPSVARFFLLPEQVAWVQGQSWGRVFIAAFGYMVIVRAKVMTINPEISYPEAESGISRMARSDFQNSVVLFLWRDDHKARQGWWRAMPAICGEM